MTGTALAALILLATLAIAALPLWRSLPPVRRMHRRAGLVLVAALLALGGSAVLAWDAPALHGLYRLAGLGLVILASLTGGGPTASATLRLADPGRRDRPGPADPNVLHGGAWVGALERLGVTGALLAGWPEGLAVALAIKGLGRYPELRDPAAAERFIIGTFASVLWACACAGVGISLVR